MSHKIRPFEMRDGPSALSGWIRAGRFQVLVDEHQLEMATIRVGRDGFGEFALVGEGVFALPDGAKLEIEAEAEDVSRPRGISLRLYRYDGIVSASYFDAEGVLRCNAEATEQP